MKALWMLLLVAAAAVSTGCNAGLMRESDLRETTLRQSPLRHEPEGQLFNRGYKHTPRITHRTPAKAATFRLGAGDGLGREVFAKAVTLARAEPAGRWSYASDRAVYAAFEPRRARAPQSTRSAAVARAGTPRVEPRRIEEPVFEPVSELAEVLAGEASETLPRCATWMSTNA
jgi:hypothetical protein